MPGLLTFKVVLVGDGKVGKTRLLTRWKYPDIGFDEFYEPTVSPELTTEEVCVNGQKVRLQVWDMGFGEADATAQFPQYVGGAAGAVLMYDMSDAFSVDGVEHWHEQVRGLAGPTSAFVVGGCKSDCPQAAGVVAKACSFCEAHKLQHVETSALTGNGVERLFEALAHELLRQANAKEELPVRVVRAHPTAANGQMSSFAGLRGGSNTTATHPSGSLQSPAAMAPAAVAPLAENKPRRVKLVLLGDAGVGKSCVAQRLSGDTMPIQEDYVPTAGAEISTKRVTVDGAKLTLQVWDAPGSDLLADPKTYAPMAQDLNAAIVVYDVTSKSSFESIGDWMRLLEAYTENSTQVLLLGNKADHAPRAVSEKDGRARADGLRVAFAEFSARRDTDAIPILERLMAGGRPAPQGGVATTHVAAAAAPFQATSPVPTAPCAGATNTDASAKRSDMAAAARERVIQRAAAARASAGEQLHRDAVAKVGAGQTRLGACFLRDRDRGDNSVVASGAGETNTSPAVPWGDKHLIRGDNWSNRADDSLSSTAASSTGANAVPQVRRDSLSNSGGKSMGNVKDILQGIRNKEPRHSEPLPKRSHSSIVEDLDVTQRIEEITSAANRGPPAQQARQPVTTQVGTSQQGGLRGQDGGSGGYSSTQQLLHGGNSDAALSTFGKGGYPPQQTVTVPEGADGLKPQLPMPTDSIDGFERRPRLGFGGQQAGGTEEDEVGGIAMPMDRALNGSVFFPPSGGTQAGQMRGGALAALPKASQSQSVVFGHMGEARRGVGDGPTWGEAGKQQQQQRGSGPNAVGAGGMVYSPRILDNAVGGSGASSAEINKSHQSVKGPQISPSASLGEAVAERRPLNALSSGSHHLPASGNARGTGISRGPTTAASMGRGAGTPSTGNADVGGRGQTQSVNRMGQRSVLPGRGSVVGRADGASGSRPGAGDPISNSLSNKVGVQQPGRSGVSGLQSRGNTLSASTGGQATAQDGTRNVGQSPPRNNTGSAMVSFGANASYAAPACGGRPGGTSTPISMRPGLAAGGAARQQSQFSRPCASGTGGMRPLQQSQGLGQGAYARR